MDNGCPRVHPLQPLNFGYRTTVVRSGSSRGIKTVPSPLSLELVSTEDSGEERSGVLKGTD